MSHFSSQNIEEPLGYYFESPGYYQQRRTSDITFLGKSYDSETTPPVEIKITKPDDSALPNPYRLGISAGGNDRKQQLKATVKPAPQTDSVDIVGSSKLTVSNVSKNAGTGVITFNVVGSSASSSAGDSTIKAKIGNQEFASKNVSVVIPMKISNHSVGNYYVNNLAINSGTSPGIYNVGLSHVYLVTAHCKTATITVQDQFNAGIGDVYLGATVAETGGDSNDYPINQTLSSASTYMDPLCLIIGSTTVNPNVVATESNVSIITAWLAASREPLVTQSGGSTATTGQIRSARSRS